jgi:hypothetical protein
MKPCSNDDGCRSNYLCALPSRITQNSQRLPEVCPAIPENEQIARIIDLESSKARSQVCAALVQGDACGDDPVNGQEPDGGVP